MTLLASCVYGSTPAVKASIMTDALLRTVSASMLELQNQALNQQNEVLVARAACILLCNVLAGCDANVVKVSAIMAAAIQRLRALFAHVFGFYMWCLLCMLNAFAGHAVWNVSRAGPCGVQGH